jgi:hypothetical protein
MMLAIGLSCIAFIMLRYIPSIPSFIRVFILKGHWIFIEGFFCIYWDSHVFFVSWLLLLCCITFNDLHMLNHPCIPGMKPMWSWCIFLICYWIWFAIFYWGFLDLSIDSLK